MKVRISILLSLLFLFILTGCDLIESIAPAPEDTPVPTEKVIEPTATPEPTLGEPEYIDAAYCWESHIDEGEYNLVRFFPSGNLIDVFVQPYTSCAEAWEGTYEYLTEENLMAYNHGSYHLSGTWIVFTLSPPNSTEVSGEVKGTYGVNLMRLIRGGADERDYILIYTGE
jgi:hypothetical protein